MDFHWVMNTLFNVNKVHVADTEHLILTFEGQIRQHCTCCDLLLPNQDVFQGESSRGELVLLPDMPLPLPRDQAEGLVAVGLAQAWNGDQPPGVSHLLHKVLGGCGKHFECHTHTHTLLGLFAALPCRRVLALDEGATSRVFFQTREVFNNAGGV